MEKEKEIDIYSMITGVGLGVYFSLLAATLGLMCSGCSSPTNPIVCGEESLEDDIKEYINSGETLSEKLKRLIEVREMEYINAGKTLSERLKRFREAQEEDLLWKEGDLK